MEEPQARPQKRELVPHPQSAMHDATIRKYIKNSGERFAKLVSPEHTNHRRNILEPSTRQEVVRVRRFTCEGPKLGGQLGNTWSSPDPCK